MFSKTRIGKILLIIGILLLTGLLLQVLNSYYWKGSLPTLIIGWYLTILGASLISSRASAWAFFLIGFYLWLIFFKALDANIERFLGFLALLIPSFHILIGLLIGIESFRRSRKDKAIYNKK